ncbi:MAG: hypothetical protein ABL867_04745 [Rickettsiales bacterium]
MVEHYSKLNDGKSISCNFDADPNVGKIVTDPTKQLLAKYIVFKPRAIEVSDGKVIDTPETVHIAFNNEISTSHIPFNHKVLNSSERLVRELEDMVAGKSKINGRELILTPNGRDVSKRMMYGVLAVLANFQSISRSDHEMAAAKFGIELPKVEMDKPADPEFREVSFPNMTGGPEKIKTIKSRRGELPDPFPTGRNR